MNKETCAFCNKDEIQTRTLMKNKHFAALIPRTKLNSKHTIIITNKHRKNLLELTPDESKNLITFIRKFIATTYNTPVAGYNIFTNIGKAAGQTIEHFHIHILPRSPKEKKSPFKKLLN